MTTLTDAAAEAFLSGWVLTGAPVTDRAHAGCLAAAGTAVEYRHDPRILETVLTLGSVEATWSLVHGRRERLLAKHLRTVIAAWKACTADLDPRDVVRAFRRDAYITSEAATKDPTKRWWQDAGIATALGWLRRTYHHDGYDALVAALADAIRAGMAEGEADALALAAARQGKTGFAIDQAFKDAYARLASDHDIDRQAADAATRIIDGAAADAGRRLASLAGDGTGEDDMADGVSDVLDTGNAPGMTVQDLLWGAFAGAALALFTQASGQQPGTAPGDTSQPVMVNWVTESGNPCKICLDIEAGSPYLPQDVPPLPQHPRCQCEIYAATNVPASYFAAYLLD